MNKLIPLLVFATIFSSSSGQEETTLEPDKLVLTGSTPCDQLMKSTLYLPSDELIDFMKWELTLTGNADKGSFLLNLNYGESQPNTSGFKQGGKNISCSGKYDAVLSDSENLHGTVYSLRSNDKTGIIIRMIKVNENIFHLLTNDDRLFIGNGGWSYTLNRKPPLQPGTLPVLTDLKYVLSDTTVKSVFDGRTPCSPIAAEYNFPASGDCFKIKWRLTLLRDPQTHLPGEYILQNIFAGDRKATGTWEISVGTPLSPGVVIYRLDPGKPEKSLSFLAADRNVLYFLDRNDQIFTGNSDFSFTLNRVPGK